MRRKYHQSQIHAFLTCPIQYRFRYVDGIVTPPKAALTVGSSVDTAVSKNLSQKITTGIDLSEEEVLDAFSADFDRRKPETEWGVEEDAGKQKDVGAKLVALHHKEVAPQISPETVQEVFHLETDAGFDLGGTLDLTEKNGVIVDTKTAKMKYAEDAVSRALQPALYDFAYEQTHGKPAEGFRYDVLIKPTKTIPARLQQVKGRVSHDDRNWLFNTINQVHKAVEAGVETPAPDGAWWCSKDWCGYWHMCKGKTNG